MPILSFCRFNIALDCVCQKYSPSKAIFCMQKQGILLGITIPMVATSLSAIEMPAEAPASATTAAAEPSEFADTVSLQEITVRANFLNQRTAPISLTTIQPADIRLHTTARNYVEMMQGTPGVYATASTGNYGDATLNMRGFKQENIAILLNGIPIQGLTSGSMYWNNWMGLQDATYAVQIQKGLGGSMLADCAMGGMVNIITRRSGFEPKGEVAFSTNAWGTTKTTANYSSGQLANGWSIDLSLAYVKGDGWVECSDVQTFSYMLNISKRLGEHNTLIFTALGSPEQHDQRNTELTDAEVSQFGRDYSKNWGYLRGQAYSIGRNHYYKPYFTLQHLMDGQRLTMKNSLYLAIADGGGRSTYSASGATPIIAHQTPDGHIDFDAVLRENSDGVSKNIILDYLSGHTQMGAITTADYALTDAWKLSAGLQYQYYDTWSKMEVLDMLGGEVFKLYGSDYRLGDQIGSAYGRTTHHASGYVQGQYQSEALTANLGVSAFNGNYQRHNDLTGETSDWATGWGYSVKGGIFVPMPVGKGGLYVNAGYNSRLPYASTYLASSDLKITNDIINEKNLMAELGYRTSWAGGGLDASAYIASWRDRTLSVSIQNRTNQAKENFLVTGLDALHMGIEVSAHHQLTHWLRAKVYAMLASWRWQGDGDAHVYDKYTNEDLGGYTIYCDGLHVGDAPQTQLGAQLQARLPYGLQATLGWQCNARMYADFEPKNRTDKNDVADSYRIPSYHLIDANLSWERSFGRTSLQVFVSGTNLTDTHYIERATDGRGHDLQSLTGYWGMARTLSGGLRLGF